MLRGGGRWSWRCDTSTWATTKALVKRRDRVIGTYRSNHTVDPQRPGLVPRSQISHQYVTELGIEFTHYFTR